EIAGFCPANADLPGHLVVHAVPLPMAVLVVQAAVVVLAEARDRQLRFCGLEQIELEGSGHAASSRFFSWVKLAATSIRCKNRSMAGTRRSRGCGSVTRRLKRSARALFLTTAREVPSSAAMSVSRIRPASARRRVTLCWGRVTRWEDMVSWPP